LLGGSNGGSNGGGSSGSGGGGLGAGGAGCGQQLPRLGADGATALGLALESNSTLTRLRLDENELGDGAIALGRALLVSLTLRHLSLALAEVSAEGGRALATGLAANSSLLSLDLSGNRRTLREPAIARLGKALETNASLTALAVDVDPRAGDLSEGSSAGAIAIGRALAANTTLRELHLCGHAHKLGRRALGAVKRGWEAGGREPTRLVLMSSQVISRLPPPATADRVDRQVTV
jgi:hypothetical protein